MKQVSNAIKSFILSSPRHRSISNLRAISKYRFVILLAGFAMLITSCHKEDNHHKKTVPFKGKMTLIVKGNTVSGTGTATHIGRFTLVEPNNSIERNADGSLTITGTAIITAANGDEIHATHSGTVHFLSNGMAQVTAEFTITGGTGRFAGATGSFEAQSLTNPGDFTFDGSISY